VQLRRVTATDNWSAGAAYEPYVGRWSRRVAREFLAWLGAPSEASWVDVGCGTGALTEAILAMSSPDRVLCIDAAPAFVTYARGRVGDTRTTFVVGDARALPLDRESADSVVSALMINFVPQPELALFEMVRVARDGGSGTVAAYVWDYAEGMQMMRHFWDAAIELDPDAAALDEGNRFPLCRPNALEALWTSAGLQQVETASLEIATRFRDFGDFWQPFLGGQGPAPGYVASLDDKRRERLRLRLREEIPVGADGTIQLTARAYAVRGRRA
jgi:SAM-dependent methyltransferase